jgi:2-octaprenyl-6-methoxyphenol hydroxylase
VVRKVSSTAGKAIELPALPNGHSDVLIAGGGFAGFALAIALRQALGGNFTVTLADPAVGQTGRDVRASAIAAAPRRMFAALGVWDAVADEAQPILDMAITDSRVDDAVRPVFLTFGGEIEPGEPFAHMIENGRLVAALSAKAVSAGVAVIAAAVADFAAETSAMNATLRNGAAIRTKLLVAADGARSRLRERAGIATYGWSYGQSAIVTTVAHERSHQGRAEEHFLPSGPFAILPLRHNRSSIVWTERTEEAERIVALPDDDFHLELEKRFGLRLGDIAVSGPRRAYPLGLWVARSFIADRLALVGDAAHVIHPIAGQGLNLGIRDVAALAELVVDARRLGLDIAQGEVLARYERWRRFDNLTLAAVTDGLNRLFSNAVPPVRLARDVGLAIVDRLPPLKRLLMRHAMGVVGELPRLVRGERL